MNDIKWMKWEIVKSCHQWEIFFFGLWNCLIGNFYLAVKLVVLFKINDDIKEIPFILKYMKKLFALKYRINFEMNFLVSVPKGG